MTATATSFAAPQTVSDWSLPRLGKATSALLLAAVALSSFHVLRIGSVNFTVSDLLFSILFAVLFMTHRVGMVPLAAMTPAWLMCVALMLSGLFIGSLVNGDVLRWAIVAGQYIFSFVMLPMIIVNQPVRTLHRMGLAFVSGVTLIEVCGIAAYYYFPKAEDAVALLGHDFITGGRRLGSFLGEANWNGAMIAMALQFVIFLTRKHILRQWLGIVIAIILLWALTLTASFTAFTAAIVAAAINTFVGRSLPSPKFVIAGALLLVVLWQTGYSPPQIFTKRVGGAYANGDLDEAGTYTSRKALVIEAWKKVETTTFIGMGVDQYREFSVQKQPVHNIYLLMWAEGGVFAMLGWLGLVMIMIMAPLAALRVDRLAAALGCSLMLVFVTVSLATPHMFGRLWMVPVLIACGISLSARRLHPRFARMKEPTDPNTKRELA